MYPIFLRLDGCSVLVVGGGRVAERKVSSLLSSGADVTVVATEFTEKLQDLGQKGAINSAQREFKPSDIEGKTLVFCATDNRQVNEEVFEQARCRNIPVNVVDVPDLCTFFVPSVLRRGALGIAVSTSGAAPSVARDVRCELEERFPSWWEDYLDAMSELRALIKDEFADDPVLRAQMLEDAGPYLRAEFEQGTYMGADEAFAVIAESKAAI